MNPDLDGDTEAALKRFQCLVLRWSESINLVSSPDRQHIWNRHILDSVQMFHVKQNWGPVYLDVGSGGGFPVVPLAVLLRANGGDTRVISVESDLRKAAFLRAASRELGLCIEVIAKRVEDIAPLGANTITARAVSNLSTLLAMVQGHLAHGGTALFPKGQSWQKEVLEARANWSFDLREHTSMTHGDSRILEVSNLHSIG